MSYLLLQRFQLQLLSLPKTAARIILSQKKPCKNQTATAEAVAIKKNLKRVGSNPAITNFVKQV
jgi:hypothetical protein